MSLIIQSHSSVKSTPSKLLLGYDQHDHADKNLKKHIDSWLEINVSFSEQRDKARKMAIQANDKLKNYNKSYFDKRHRKPTQYKQGSLGTRFTAESRHKQET